MHPDERIRSITEFREALELPTFWAEMQRQSVELGALRSHSGHTGFGTLDGLEDEVAPSKAEPVDAPVDAEAEAARADIERRRRERARRQAAGQGRARDEGARRSSAHPSTGGRTKASAGRSVKARWGGHALAVTAVLALLGWAAWRPAEVPAVARAERPRRPRCRPRLWRPSSNLNQIRPQRLSHQRQQLSKLQQPSPPLPPTPWAPSCSLTCRPGAWSTSTGK